MSRLLVRSFAVSIDGFGAGTDQDLENPLGVRGPELMEWFFHTRTWRAMNGQDGGETGVDDEIAARGMQGFGAWILGRNMFGPVRGPWPARRRQHLSREIRPVPAGPGGPVAGTGPARRRRPVRPGRPPQ